jgi:hypothetical protein
MTVSHTVHRTGRGGWAPDRVARSLAVASLGVLASGAVLFGAGWAVGGEDAVSDNWVGLVVAVALFAGLGTSLAAFVTAVLAGVRHEPWARMWLALGTFPAVVVVLALLEAFVLE